MRVLCVAKVRAVTGAPAAGARQKDTAEPCGELRRDLLEIQVASRARRAFDAQRVTVIVVITLERLEHEVVQREPDRTAPVRVPTEQSRRRVTGRVFDAMLGAVHLETIRLVPGHAAEGAQTGRGEKIRLLAGGAEDAVGPVGGKRRR